MEMLSVPPHLRNFEILYVAQSSQSFSDFRTYVSNFVEHLFIFTLNQPFRIITTKTPNRVIRPIAIYLSLGRCINRYKNRCCQISTEKKFIYLPRLKTSGVEKRLEKLSELG